MLFHREPEVNDEVVEATEFEVETFWLPPAMLLIIS
jgi:hypothetical protein